MQKVLIFTHGIDIEGYGGAILGQLAFEEPEICFADNFNLDEKFINKLENREITNFDKIFIVDHCLSYEVCEIVNKNETIKNKIRVFDHHNSRLAQNDFSWVNVIDKDSKGKCSGTSLFYQFLIKEGLLKKTAALDNYVELTRAYDTWEWTKTDNQDANRLNVLALALGREDYIAHMLDKLTQNAVFVFDETENACIDNFLYEFNLKVKYYFEKIQKISFQGFRAGYVEIEEFYKNDIATRVRTSHLAKELDFLLMPIVDLGTVSLRNVKEGFDVSKVAEIYGGGGHAGAASFPLKNLNLHGNSQEM